MRVQVELDLDDVFEQLDLFCIMGPSDECNGWTVFLPGEVPCICDSFKEAAQTMRESLKRRKAGK